MSKLVLTEFLEFRTDSDLLTEAERKAVQEGEEIYLAGVMQRAGATNGNGRIYPKQILEREVENYQKLVREGRAVGELDHPDSSVVELKNASHLKGGVKLGISSRGLGSTRQESGKTIVQEDFQLVCFDLVSEPSTTGAFMLREGKEPNIFTKADKINRLLNDLVKE